jgi:hypothetical protein
MKLVTDRPYSDPEKAARKIVEIANSVEGVQDGRIYIELINVRSCSARGARRTNTRLASTWRSSGGWLVLHESGTFVRYHARRCRAVRLTPADATAVIL